jgi:DNA-directed RNA polymerase specialized sigma24 family protein
MCLSARSKEILRLSLLEGMDYRVIAARVGLSKNYTAKVLSESKSRLRGYLGEDFPYEYQVNKIKCFGTYLEKDYDYANR